MSALPPARIALIGARRVRQGLGPFVARDLAAAGLEVVAVLGTRPDSARASARELAEVLGREPSAYTDLGQLRAEASPDALAILSPSATHEAYLEAALDAGLHVLCEKPLVWGGTDLAGRARRIVDGFRTRGLLLVENCQWPWVLDAYRALHPETPADPPRRFWMQLSPVSEGVEVLGDSLPHPLSVLQALVPGAAPRLEALRLEGAGPRARDLDLRFELVAQGGRVDCHVELRHCPSPPRPAALALDGRGARRRISLPSYRMELVDGDCSVPLPDPLTAHLRAFAGQLEAVRSGGPPADPEPVAIRMARLAQVVEALQDQGPV